MKKNEKKFGKFKKGLYLCIGLGTIAQLNIFHNFSNKFIMANLAEKYADLANGKGKVWFMGLSNHMDLAAKCVPSHTISDLCLFGRSAHDQVAIFENGDILTRKVLATTEWQTTVGFALVKNHIQRKLRIRRYTSEGVLISEQITLE